MAGSDKKRHIATKNVTKTAYAAMRGVSRQAVHKAIREGKLKGAVDEQGRIIIAVADRLWAANTDPSIGHHGQLKQRAVRSSDEMVERAIQVGVDPNAVPTLLESKTLEAAYRAKLAQIEYEEKTGELVSVEQVKKEAFRLARIVRDGMFGIADRIAAEVAGISDPFVIHKKLTDEIRSALAEVKTHE